MKIPSISLLDGRNGVAIEFGGLQMVAELGAAMQTGSGRRATFDGSLRLDSVREEAGNGPLGPYNSVLVEYHDEDGPLVLQALKKFQTGSANQVILVETTALRDITGASTGDSYFETTFNSPVMVLAENLRYLTYTWGLRGGEGTGIGGNFSDVAVARNIAELPGQLRLADFSPNADVHHTGEKPFAPLIAYDESERTLVVSPLDHFLISPMRLMDTPRGPAVARGVHGAVDFVPSGTVTTTALVFGQGLVDTVLKWGNLLATAKRGGNPKRANGPELDNLGFWNCYGGYYAQLFRPTTAETLLELSRSFGEDGVPCRYFGLDLWYPHQTVGFAVGYDPDPVKYPDGLAPVSEESELPFLFHMSAFDRDTSYLDSYEFSVEEGAAYPLDRKLYRDLARDFRSWGAAGVWHDFLRTQLQNCLPLRANIGAADRLFEDFVQSMDEQGLDVMMCMPTIGHYLASTAYENVVAVRTSTDYVNHQPGQAGLLREMEEYRSVFPPGRNHRQNFFLAFLAGALGLAPYHDVFITNSAHPEGFGDPNAEQEALARALSCGLVGIGDKIGEVDKGIVHRLAFPDGSLAQPDHPPYPLASTLQSRAPTFFTHTTVSGHTWTYVVIWNLGEAVEEYTADLTPLLKDGDLIFDYFSGHTITSPLVSGEAGPGLARYLVVAPSLGGHHLLGLTGKYVMLPRRQANGILSSSSSISVDMELPPGHEYTIATAGGPPVRASGAGLEVLAMERRSGLDCTDFLVHSSNCRLELEF